MQKMRCAARSAADPHNSAGDSTLSAATVTPKAAPPMQAARHSSTAACEFYIAAGQTRTFLASNPNREQTIRFL